MFTCQLIIYFFQIGFSSTDSVMALKLVEAGIPKERLGLIAIPLIPVQLAMPLVIAKYTTGKLSFFAVTNIPDVPTMYGRKIARKWN